MRDQRTLLAVMASAIASLSGVPVHRDLMGSEAGTSRTEIMGRARGWVTPEQAPQRAPLKWG
jgi:hypothetical protein